MKRESKGKSISLEGFSSCVKCGTCHTVCPVFSVMPAESHSARGKMALIEAVAEGRLTESDRFRDYLELCLLCGACQEACPNMVPTIPLMLEARKRAADKVGIKGGKGFILKHMLAAAGRFRFAMKTGQALQWLMFRKIPENRGIRRRFPIPVVSGERTVPRVADRFFSESFRGRVKEGSGPRVGIFSGCMVEYFYPEIGKYMVDVLDDMGVTVIVPSHQTCCGMPALAGGAFDVVKELAVKNLEEFEKCELDYIVTGCATCGDNLKCNYLQILDEAGVDPARGQDFVSRIRDINELLADLEAEADAGRTGIPDGPGIFKVTYHHPCHLGRSQGITGEPIRLIESIGAQVQYVPMEDAQRCCGMGGAFSIEHYDISSAINDHKIEMIRSAEVDAVVTSCPACIMHIRDGLMRNALGHIEVLHVVELMGRYGSRAVGAVEEKGDTDSISPEEEKLPQSA